MRKIAFSKRILSLALCLVMVLGLLPMSVFAEDASNEIKVERNVAALSQIEVGTPVPSAITTVEASSAENAFDAGHYVYAFCNSMIDYRYRWVIRTEGDTEWKNAADGDRFNTTEVYGLMVTVNFDSSQIGHVCISSHCLSDRQRTLYTESPVDFVITLGTLSDFADADHAHSVCGEAACKHPDGSTHESLSWTPLTGMEKITSGNYYLPYDVVLLEQFSNGNSLFIVGDVKLCLNGHSLTACNLIYVTVGSSLTLCDCVGTGVLDGYIDTFFCSDDGHRGYEYLEKGVVLYGKSTFTMYGGTIKNYDTVAISDGETNSTINVYGGSICENKSGIENFEGNAVNLYGGSIRNNRTGIIAKGSVHLAGDIQITDNVYDRAIGEERNLYFQNSSGGTLTADTLDPDARIGITVESTVTLSDTAYAKDRFHVDAEDNRLVTEEDDLLIKKLTPLTLFFQYQGGYSVPSEFPQDVTMYCDNGDIIDCPVDFEAYGYQVTDMIDVTGMVAPGTMMFPFVYYTDSPAYWVVVSPIHYTIAYEGLDGATLTAENPESYTVADNFTLNNPEDPNGQFLGWLKNGEGELSKTVTVEQGTKGDITFTAVWKKDILLGDVNFDGKSNTADARYTLCYMVGISGELTEKEKVAADINEDGEINSLDARRMLWIIVNEG